MFETRNAYEARMKRRSNILRSNANLVKLIREYRKLKTRGSIHYLGMERNIVSNARKLLSNHGINPNRGLRLTKNSSNSVPYHSRYILNKILRAVPNNHNRYVYVNNPNGTKSMGRKNN